MSFQIKQGLSEAVIKKISAHKKEPAWMRGFRLEAYQAFKQKPMPAWGVDLSKIDFKAMSYYMMPLDKRADSWEQLPAEIKQKYDELGIPEAERNFLAGVAAQYESQVVYEKLKEELGKQGVIFTDTDTALKEHPKLFKKYFGTVVGLSDNKFAALNSAAWSGGSFIYIPKGVKVERPLQAFFLMGAARIGQFERTLIIADEGSFVHYVEGCTAPIYQESSLHAAVVEVIVKKGARVRYTTVQNWSKNVYNLTTKRARVEEDGVMEWVDGNIGSKATMKYPACLLVGERAHGEMLSLSFAGAGQHQDTGAKMIHLAPKTTSRIMAKSVSKDGGRSSYRGLVYIAPKAKGSASYVSCDALIMDDRSRSDTYPVMRVQEKQVRLEHEATVDRIGEEKLFYLMSRGISCAEAESLLVAGFIEPIVKEIPLEYAVELNRLISLEMEGSVG
ncbi:MAG: Fe-S cluster assembly protein SufB [bacterium]|nr:Fe-S cluster assembly protein SufB [bacterium]